MAYRPVLADCSLAGTSRIKDIRWVARHNTMKYHWRDLTLLPGVDRPNCASLRSAVLARATRELRIGYC